MNSKFAKKAVSVGLALTTSVWLSGAAMVVPVGAQTAADIQAQINALLVQIQALQAQLGQTGGTGVTACSFSRDLTLGSKGDDVTCLQNYLTGTGHFTYSGGATGYFGPITQAAVAAWQTANAVTPPAGYFGPISRAKYTSVAGTSGTPGTPGTPAVGAPLSVSVATDTPVSQNILAGSANVTVAKVNLTGSATEDTSVSALTVKSYGTANLNANDILLVKIYDGATQVGLSQTQVNGISNFVFSPAVQIAKGTTKTLSILVSMQTIANGATASATVKMGIESAASITGATFTGTFPVVGNAMSIVAGGALGVLNVAAGAVVPANQTYVGAKDVVLGTFTVSAGTNEDINVWAFNVSRTAASTAQDTDVSNIRIKVDGGAAMGGASFSVRRASVVFPTPVLLAKGTSKSFQVIGDIVSGGGLNITLQADIDAASGIGVTSGAGVAGPAAAFNLGAGNLVAIAAGNLSISVSSSSPQGSSANLVISTTPQTLGVFDVRAIGENVLVSNVNMALADGALNTEAGTIGNVGLYDENGALLSQQVNLLGVAGDGINFWGPAAGTTFVMNWTVPANTTKKLYVKGTTNLVTAPNPASANAVLVLVGGNSFVATGLSSSGQAGANNITSASVLALPPVSVNQAGTFATVGDTINTPYNQNVLGPVSQTVLGTIKLTTQNEDQRLRDAVLTGVTSAGAVNAYVTGVALYDGATQITNFITPGTGTLPAGGGATANDVVFTTADVLTPTTFVKGTPKTLNIVGNVISPLPAQGTTLRWTIGAVANHFRTTGVTSGVVATNNAAATDFRVNVGADNEGGTYTFRSNVLEMKKSASSPSGTVARGTFATYAAFDLESKGANANLGVDTLVFATDSLPAALTSSVTATGVLNDAALFRLYDVDGGIAIPATRFLNVAAGTIAFSGIPNGALTVTFGQVRHIALQITTTNQALWPVSSSMQWAVGTQASALVGSRGTVLVAGDPDLGTVVALQTAVGAGAAGVSGELRKSGAAGGAFVLGTDAAYIDTGATGAVAAGDIRVSIGADAARGLGFTSGSIVIAGDADVGTVIALPTAVAGQLMKSGAAGALFVYGTDAAYIKTVAAGALVAGDTRLSPGAALNQGRNWQGGIGFGGSTYGIPAVANTVVLP